MTSPFQSGITFSPQGQWNIAGNTQTLVPYSYWSCISSSDPNTAVAQGRLAMVDNSGNIVLPDNHKYLICLYYDLSNDFAYTGTSATVSMIYTPKNGNSLSPTYTMGSCQALCGTIRNTVIGNSGDTISLMWLLSNNLNASSNTNGCNTRYSITDISGPQDSLYYYVPMAGSPLLLGTQQANYVMQTAPIISGIATFVLTQDGTPAGQSVFTKIISKCTITVQVSGTTSTTLTPPSNCYILPYPANLSTIQAVFESAGTANVTWNATIQVTGL